MENRRWIGRTLAATAALAVTLTLALHPVAAAEATVLDLTGGAIEGVTFTATAVGTLDTPPAAEGLVFERMTLDACAVTNGFANFGPVLIAAEGYEVTVRIDEADTHLAQGESIVVPTGSSYALINGMVDSSFEATVDLLSVGGGSTDHSLAASLAAWPDGSSCSTVATDATAIADTSYGGISNDYGTNYTQLYIGYAILEPGATTEGFVMTHEGASLNMLILSGSLHSTGMTTGRDDIHVPGEVVSDHFISKNPGCRSGCPTSNNSEPFANPGSAPVLGIIFGTTSDNQPVFAAKA